ncbi:hypothetical protein [Shewanella zhangzhouensis]|uniref:hypothetical protein n=1 Tax=Shewanella zhangzhouensis TaxID=2864213 RepID=UPI001C6553C1|nr:hypothetical protein [Shewanella zhangzhouensis]QYK06663.1 hypothetical protein K0H63_07580 [Shewanella zhangzhouensis]
MDNCQEAQRHLLAVLDSQEAASTQALINLTTAFSTCACWPTLLLNSANDSANHTSVTWLLKAWLEQGNRLDDQQSATWLALTPALTQWQARLHILQCLPGFSIPESLRSLTEHMVREALADSNKFVRAWAYTGLDTLARQFPQYRDERNTLFQMSLQDEAPSVKARIRQLIKAQKGEQV